MNRPSIIPTSEDLDAGALRLGIPGAGRLNSATMDLFARAELPLKRRSERIFHGSGERWDKLWTRYIRPHAIATSTGDGHLDAGVTAHNLVMETGNRVEEVLELDFGRCRVVVAAREGVTLEELDGKTIATSYPNITNRFFNERGRRVDIHPCDGAVEAYPEIGLADGIVDVTETGTSLKDNGLVVIADIMTTRAVLVANGSINPAQRDNLDFIKRSLEGAMEAKNFRKVVCTIPNTETDIAAFLAIYRYYSPPDWPYIKDLRQIAGNEQEVTFEFLANSNSVSKVLKVLESGHSSGLKGLGRGRIKTELSKLSMVLR
jgi:ATP phosphoribosyltransferase